MAKLQIDGTEIAEVDADLAAELIRMFWDGLGRNQKPATFQRFVSDEPRKLSPPVETLAIVLEFQPILK